MGEEQAGPGRLSLVGLMGAGKSEVARVLASRLGWRLLDLDAEVEQEQGLTIAELFRDAGEEDFRELESQVLARLLATPGNWILACGGGTVLREANRQALRSSGPVVWLDAPSTELAQRVQEDHGSLRPLLSRGSEPIAVRLEVMRRERQQAYAAAADRILPTTGRTVEQVADDLLSWLGERRPVEEKSRSRSGGWTSTTTTTQEIRGGRGSSELLITEDGLESLGRVIRRGFPNLVRCPVITDRQVGRLHGPLLEQGLREAGITPARIEMEPGEGSKTLATVCRLWDELAQLQVDRTTPLIALGGGVVSDVAGFVAATWLRGVPWVVVPTTLLAQVDAGVGGKTGIDHRSGKNRIGAFHQPWLVFCAMPPLATLPSRELRAGLAEAVKTALIGDGELFGHLEEHAPAIAAGDPALLAEVVRRCLAVKTAIVQADPHEHGLRRVLNLGHTVGHALEAASWSQPEPLLHGEAVALGLLAASRVAVALGRSSSAAANRVRTLLARLGLPCDLDRWLGQVGDDWKALLLSDKKRQGGRIALQLPEAMGRVTECWLLPEELSRLVMTETSAPLMVEQAGPGQIGACGPDELMSGGLR